MSEPRDVKEGLHLGGVVEHPELRMPVGIRSGVESIRLREEPDQVLTARYAVVEQKDGVTWIRLVPKGSVRWKPGREAMWEDVVLEFYGDAVHVFGKARQFRFVMNPRDEEEIEKACPCELEEYPVPRAWWWHKLKLRLFGIPLPAPETRKRIKEVDTWVEQKVALSDVYVIVSKSRLIVMRGDKYEG